MIIINLFTPEQASKRTPTGLAKMALAKAKTELYHQCLCDLDEDMKELATLHWVDHPDPHIDFALRAIRAAYEVLNAPTERAERAAHIKLVNCGLRAGGHDDA